MKKVIRFIIWSGCLVCMSFQLIIGQSTNIKQGNNFNVWVTKLDQSSKTKGSLYTAEDSLIRIMNYSAIGGTQHIDVSNIKEIKFRKKGKPFVGFVLGAVIGFGAGAIIGFSLGDDEGGFISFSAKEKAFITGTILAIPGSIIGMIAGHSMSIKIPIYGNYKMYNSQKKKLKEYEMGF